MIDVTNQFLEACSELNYGELVMAPQLGMMEAMNALVIMDPRMDTGCRSPLKDGQEAAKQGMEDSLVDVCELVYDVESICAIMDRILELEMTYHTGASLVQTLFMSRHMLQLYHLTLATLDDGDESGTLLSQVLVPYVHAVRLCMTLVWNELIKGNVQDGEDFTSDTGGLWPYGLEWNVPRPEGTDADQGQDCDWMLEDVLERIEWGLEWLDTAGLPEHEVQQLRARIEFRHSFLRHLVVVLSPSYHSMPITMPQDYLSEALDSLLEQTSPTTETQSHQSSSDTNLAGMSDESRNTVQQSFDTHVYRRFRQNIPKTNISIVHGQEFRHVVKDLVDGIEMCERMAQCGIMTYWERELVALGSGKRPTLPFVRSALMSTFYPIQGVLVTGCELQREHITETFILEEAGILSKRMSAWLTRCLLMQEQSVAESVRTWENRLTSLLMSDMNLLLLNIPRARRMLLSRMNQWEELHITLPRAPIFSHLPTEDLERALIRQRWACGFLGWLAGFQSEVWGTGPVGRDRKGKRLPGGRIDFLALAWWWFEVITDQLMQNALPETPNRYTRTWKRYWWTGWRALARGFLQTLALVENCQQDRIDGPNEVQQNRVEDQASVAHFKYRLKHFTSDSAPLMGSVNVIKRAHLGDWKSRWNDLLHEATDSHKTLRVDIVENLRLAASQFEKLSTFAPSRSAFTDMCGKLATDIDSNLLPPISTDAARLSVSMRSTSQVQSRGQEMFYMWLPVVQQETDEI